MVAWGVVLANLPTFVDLGIRIGNMLAKFRPGSKGAIDASPAAWAERIQLLENQAEEQARLLQDLVARTEAAAKTLAAQVERNRRISWAAIIVAVAALATALAAVFRAVGNP